MIYYYGRKKRLARYYPQPTLDRIIEPFAGAASYALYGDNWQRDVLLVEKDERMAAVWEWLIGEATADTIRDLPVLTPGERSSEFLTIVHGVSKMDYCRKSTLITPVIARKWEASKRFMSENIHKVKNWRILTGDYTEAPDVEATWFVDPPYRGEPGMGYRFGSSQLDYALLAEWIMTRRGEVIACEGVNGDYLPFRVLKEINSVAGKRSKETYFYRQSKES